MMKALPTVLIVSAITIQVGLVAPEPGVESLDGNTLPGTEIGKLPNHVDIVADNPNAATRETAALKKSQKDNLKNLLIALRGRMGAISSTNLCPTSS
jgi:hypothetical protein